MLYLSCALKKRKYWKIGALLVATAFLWGCETARFYTQAVKGQLQILSHRQKIEKLLDSLETPSDLKGQLSLTLQIRDFAEEEMDLPAKGNFLSYCDLNRDFVVWNVYATEEFSLDDKTWWYPFVGNLSYRGYFSKQDAQRYANKLRPRGYDVYIGGVDAYSTLGWFHDPVFNTFIDYDETDLAAIIIHELAHKKIFAKGDTDFNEAFATAVEREGVKRWLLARGKTKAYDAYEAELDREAEFVALVERTRARLDALYHEASRPSDSGDKIPDKSLREEKEQVFDDMRAQYEQMKEQWNGNSDFDAWFESDLNNARLNSVDTYYALIPAFNRILQSHHGNLEGFYQEVRKLSRLPENQRKAKLNRLEKSVGN